MQPLEPAAVLAAGQSFTFTSKATGKSDLSLVAGCVLVDFLQFLCVLLSLRPKRQQWLPQFFLPLLRPASGLMFTAYESLVQWPRLLSTLPSPPPFFFVASAQVRLSVDPHRPPCLRRRHERGAPLWLRPRLQGGPRLRRVLRRPGAPRGGHSEGAQACRARARRGRVRGANDAAERKALLWPLPLLFVAGCHQRASLLHPPSSNPVPFLGVCVCLCLACSLSLSLSSGARGPPSGASHWVRTTATRCSSTRARPTPSSWRVPKTGIVPRSLTSLPTETSSRRVPSHQHFASFLLVGRRARRDPNVWHQHSQ